MVKYSSIIIMLCFYAGSIFGNGGDIAISFSTNNIPDELIEDCDSTISHLILTKESASMDTLRYRIVRSGIAEDTLDYITNIPDTLLFIPGQQVDSFDLFAIQDAIEENPEQIRFDVYQIGVMDTLCDSLFVTIRDQLNLNIVVDPISDFCLPPSVRLVGSEALRYSWSPTELFSDPTNDTVLVQSNFTDRIILTGFGKGCSATDTIDLDFYSADFTHDIAPSDSICLGDSITLSIHPLLGLDTIIISPDSIVVANFDTIFYLRPVQSGEVIIEARSQTCIKSDTIYIEVDHINSPDLIADTTICRGDTLLLTEPFNNELNSTFLWSPSSGLSDSSLSSPEAFPLSSTNYTLETTGSKGICRNQDSVQINVTDQRHNYELLGLDSFCLGGQVRAALNTFDTPISTTITPNGSASLANDTITFFPSMSTEYQIELDYDYCQVRIDQDITIINPQVDVQFITPPTICLEDSIQVKLLFRVPPLSVNWSPDNQVRALNDSIYIFKPIESDSIDLLVDFGFCTYEEIIELIVVDNLFQINLPGDTTICQGESVEGILSYNREPNSIAIFPQNDVVHNGTEITFNPDRTTSYDITADFGACIITKTVLIQVDSLPNLSISPFPELTKYCQGSTIEIIPSSFEPEDYPNLSFLWSPEDINVISPVTAAGLELIARQPQTYRREAMNGACRSEISFTLDVTPDGIITPFGDTSICMGTSVPFSIMDQDISNIVWSPPRNISCEFCPDPTFAPVETTTYTVTYDREDCTFSEDVIIHVSDLDTTRFEPIIGCQDSLVQINITNPIFDNSVWDADSDLSCLNCNNPIIQLKEAKTFILRDFDAMCQHVGLQDVSVYPELSAEINLSNTDPNIFIGQDINISADIQADHDVQIEWFVNEELTNESTNLMTIVAEEFRYTIRLEVTDVVTSCQAIDELVVTIMAIDEIRFPNIFSPNDDGRNDQFKPALAHVLTINTMRIFNRWGDLVFQSSAPDASWDGRSPDGKPAPSDTYIYIVELTRPNGGHEMHQGDINLIR